jgi:hypothetical protein
MSVADGDSGCAREVVIGRNAKVWRAASADPAIATRFHLAISHTQVETFAFQRTDRVWIFAYAREPQQNERMFARLAAAGVEEVVYISSATTNVVELTACYEYPRVKRRAEQDARRILDARILSFGLVVDSVEQAPAGRNAVTLQSSINDFLLRPIWPSRREQAMLLFSMQERPFARGWERQLYRCYGAVQWWLRKWPCLLRPVDVVLRALGIRWYGYVHLSNRLWNTTI